MVPKALKPTTGNADQITMNIVSVTSATSRTRSPSAGASAVRPGEGPVNPVDGNAASGTETGAGAGIAGSAASRDSAHVGAVGEAAAASVAGIGDVAGGWHSGVGGGSAMSGIGDVGAGRESEVGRFAVDGGRGGAGRGEGVATRLTLADFARGHSVGLGPGAVGAMEMARSVAPSDTWLGQAGAAGSGAPEIAGMTGGQTNVGTASGAVPGIASPGITGTVGTMGSPVRADEYAMPAVGMGPAMAAMSVSIGYQVDTTALSVFPRAAAQRGRGLHGQLVQQLGQMIVAGELGADRPLVPEEIGNRFEVSRTVVRESLRVLEAKGLVSARPNVGTRIRPVHEWNLLDPDVIEWRALGPYRGDQARELIELRQAFEPLAAHLVAARAARLPEAARVRLAELSDVLMETAATGDVAGFHRTDAELHALLLRATDNRMLEHLATVVCGALEITGVRSFGCSPEAEVDQHASLVDRVLAGDGAGAAEVVSGLLRRMPSPAASAHLPAQRDR
jgi:DNA-binding FadR family transcriptional regulator